MKRQWEAMGTASTVKESSARSCCFHSSLAQALRSCNATIFFFSYQARHVVFMAALLKHYGALRQPSYLFFFFFLGHGVFIAALLKHYDCHADLFFFFQASHDGFC